MGKADTLYIVIPAYNEEENIEQCVNDWYPVVESHNGAGRSRLLIVNDGSKDRTCEKLRELAESRPLLEPLSKENGGHGSAVLCGYQAAVDRGRTGSSRPTPTARRIRRNSGASGTPGRIRKPSSDTGRTGETGRTGSLWKEWSASF